MPRIAFKMKLNPGMKEEYRKRHQQIWPELRQLLLSRGVSNYSIFLDEETNILFAVQNVRGGENSQDLTAEPIVQKWWAYMADIMETNADQSPVSVGLEEVFCLEE